ncbi:MAG: exosortase [Candidatus Aureabacteria bacterium]|nr:exosortase [Candidatus Auribacterota bacterium]
MLNYIIFILTALLYIPVFISLYQIRWDAVDYAHAYFILPVSLGIAFMKRGQIKENLTTEQGKNITGLLLFLSGIIAYIFSNRMDFLVMVTFSIIPLLSGLILFLYGTKMFRVLWFPILYLIFLVPPPAGILDLVTMPMRYGVSVATQYILVLFHYPVSREGLLLSIDKHDLFIGQPCSGFRSLITMISLGAAYIYSIRGTLFNKCILSLSIIPFALLGNLMRIIILALITYYFGEKAAMGFFHDFSGMFIFLIMIAALIMTEILLEKTGRKWRRKS